MAKKILTRRKCFLTVDTDSFDNFFDQTGGTPTIWRGTCASFPVALAALAGTRAIAEDDQLMDLTGSGLESLKLEVKALTDLSANVMAKEVTVFNDALTAAEWLARTAEHAAFEFTDAETNLTAGSYFMVLSGVTTDGPETFGVTTLVIREDNTPAVTEDPPTNPGAAISLGAADARYMGIDPDSATFKRAVTAVGNGVSSKAITFTTPFATAPRQVFAQLAVPSGGALIQAAVDQSTITTTGFTAVFGAATPNANYKLHSQAYL